MSIFKILIDNIELIIKLFLTIILLFPFFKTWKACEEEIKSCTNVMNNQYKVFCENIKRANEYCDKFCKIDLSSLSDIHIIETEIKAYNESVKSYQENFLNVLNKQDESIAKRQDKLFELRKNEWKSVFPFLSAIALMWLGIKF